jgi:hypothetical protein
MPSITALPLDILRQLPRHLHHLDDFLALESSCRHLRAALHLCAPGDLLALCYRSRATFFRPDPHFLLAALIPAIRQYACSSEARRVEVKRTIWHGCEVLLDWACHTPAIAAYARWSTHAIYDLWELRMNALNPVNDLIDHCVGYKWRSKPNFWEEGVEDAITICMDMGTTVFELQMYASMFGPLMSSFLEASGEDASSLGISLRLDFVKYLFPDWAASVAVKWSDQVVTSARIPSPTDYFVSHDLPTTTMRRSRVHPLAAVQTSFGPYAKDNVTQAAPLLHLIRRSPLWMALVTTLRARCGNNFRLSLLDKVDHVDPATGQYPEDLLEDDQNETNSHFAVHPIANDGDVGTAHLNVKNEDGTVEQIDLSDDDDDHDEANQASEESDFTPPSHFVADIDLKATDISPADTSMQWKQDLWEACPYALGSEFMKMMAQVWRIRGAEEVELLELRRRARVQKRRQQGVKDEEPDEAGPYDAVRHAELQARAKIARIHPDFVESGAGWDTLRRWHTAIAAMEHEPERLRVGLNITHEGYPDLVGDLSVTTRSNRDRTAHE